VVICGYRVVTGEQRTTYLEVAQAGGISKPGRGKVATTESIDTEEDDDDDER
jgi:hypothetical protein